MATIDMRRDHSLGPEEAATRLRGLVEDFQRQFPDFVRTLEWSADGREAKASGQGFEGRFAVASDHVTVAVDLNLMLRPFKKKVIQRLDQKLDEALA